MKDSREVRRALRIADRTSLGPILETDRLALRPFVPEDAEAVHAYRGDPEVMRFTGGPDRSLEETRRTIETYCRCQSKYGFSKWAVLMKATGELVGDSGLLPTNDVPEFELGYRFASSSVPGIIPLDSTGYGDLH